ncbi:MAG TPA: hypothetical protein VF475_18415 [Sphingobium sp.]
MDIASDYVLFTRDVLDGLGMSHPMAHIHAGLMIYLGVQMLLRTRRASTIALHAVIGAELVNEVLDYSFYGSWRWADTLGDIALTLLWPAAFYLMGKFRRMRWERWQQVRRQRQEEVAAVLPHNGAIPAHALARR